MKQSHKYFAILFVLTVATPKSSWATSSTITNYPGNSTQDNSNLQHTKDSKSLLREATKQLRTKKLFKKKDYQKANILLDQILNQEGDNVSNTALQARLYKSSMLFCGAGCKRDVQKSYTLLRNWPIGHDKSIDAPYHLLRGDQAYHTVFIDNYLLGPTSDTPQMLQGLKGHYNAYLDIAKKYSKSARKKCFSAKTRVRLHLFEAKLYRLFH
jgi:hypothetical protein